MLLCQIVFSRKIFLIVLIIKTITRFFGVDRLLQLLTDILPNLLAEAVAQLGEGLVVEHAPDDAVVEGELGADVTDHAVGAALAVTDVEETQIRQDADIEHGAVVFPLALRYFYYILAGLC